MIFEKQNKTLNCLGLKMGPGWGLFCTQNSCTSKGGILSVVPSAGIELERSYLAALLAQGRSATQEQGSCSPPPPTTGSLFPIPVCLLQFQGPAHSQALEDQTYVCPSHAERQQESSAARKSRGPFSGDKGWLLLGATCFKLPCNSLAFGGGQKEPTQSPVYIKEDSNCEATTPTRTHTTPTQNLARKLFVTERSEVRGEQVVFFLYYHFPLPWRVFFSFLIKR